MSAMNRRITTYRNDFNKGKYPGYGVDGQPYPGRDYPRNNYLSKSYDHSLPKFDERAMQRGRNESSEQYEDRLRHLSLNHHQEHHDNHRDNHDHRHEGPSTDRGHYHQHEHHDGYYDPHQDNHDDRHGGPLTDRGPRPQHNHHEHDRRAFDDMNMDKRMDNEEIYFNRGNLTYRRQPDGHDDPENSHHMFERFDPYKDYHMYSTTQNDYGKHGTIGRISNQPYRYRAHFDEQATNFQSTQRMHDLLPHEKPDNKVHPGVYLLIRITGSTDEFKTMEHKFEKNQSTVSSGKGKLVGITNSIHLHANISSETHGWRVNKDGTTVRDVLAVMLFDDMEDAIRWAKSDIQFKSGRSNDLGMYSWAFLRINHIPPTGRYPIYLMIEMRVSLGQHTPKDVEEFRLMVSEEMEFILKDFKDVSSPFSVNTYVNYESRLGNINAWLDRRFVFLHRFTNDYNAKEFLYRFDRYGQKAKFTYTATVFNLQ